MSTRSVASPLAVLILACALLGACGGEMDQEESTGQDPTNTWSNTTPSLLMASPDAMAVGDSLTVMGQDFIESKHGSALVLLKGAYIDDQGLSQNVDLSEKTEVISSGKLTWTMFPNIKFSKTGAQLGTFVGSIAVMNVGTDGSMKYSESLPIKIRVKPSIILHVARPVTTGCQSIVKKTVEKTGFLFNAEAVGLRAGTKDNPITFYWTFLAEQWKVAWNYGTMDPNSVFPKTGAFVLEDSVQNGRTSVVSDGGSRSFLVRVGSDLLGSSRLKELRTEEVSAEGNSFKANVNVVAVDASNKSVRLTIPMDVSRMATLSYDGSMRVAERQPPVMVCDCIPGGDIGRQVTYSEDKAETRARSMSFQYNASVGINISPIPSNPFALGINFSAGFGVDVNATVSSSKSKGMNLSGQILPGDYGVFYRQTTKIYREADIIGRNACGQTASLGKVTLTDWIFTPDLATGATCPPSSGLPPAGKFL